MASEKTNLDFLRFSAYSIKDLITRKLSQDSKFTDQIYEGSNLAILIDIFSYLAQCILYSLNNTAAESMFSDTQIYENMNRLVNFIGYNPKGITTATVPMTLAANEDYKDATIYKYSAIDTGKSDAKGNRIFYSTISQYKTDPVDGSCEILFYNGIWKLYPDVFTSNGEKYQKIVLTNIGSEFAESQFAVDKCINVYVKDANSFKEYDVVTDGIFTDNNIANGSSIYSSTDCVVNLRLNENKKYELTFGNGFVGNIPVKESQIYVFYLESNGKDGEIVTGDIIDKKIVHDNALFGITQQMYNDIFGVAHPISDNDVGDTTKALYQADAWSNMQNSSLAVAEETVDEIRRNAPQWFKTGNRLVTTSDYEYYVKNRFIDNIIDVKCQNNWQYISTFYQWLYNLGMNGQLTRPEMKEYNGKNLYRQPNATYYVNQNMLQKYDLKYADAADGNNVYLWMKMKSDSDLYRDKIDEEIINIKSLTQEAVYLKPLTLYFTPCATDKADVAYDLASGQHEVDPNNYSYIEITLDDNAIYSNADIKHTVGNIILQYFNESNFTLGCTVNYSDITNAILNNTKAKRIRTIYNNTQTGALRIVNGLSFATWSTEIVELGDDVDVSATSRTLEVFQFPKLYKRNSIEEKIKVITKSISNLNTIQY